MEDNYGGEKRTNYWKERGLGDVKILKDKTKGTVRVIMRQEKTLKPCANFALSEECSLAPMGSSTKAWVFNCHDFSDGELKPLTCSIKFKNEEIANKFRDAFDAGKKQHLEASASGEEASGGDAGGDGSTNAAQGKSEASAEEEKNELDAQAKAYRAGVEKRRASLKAQNALDDSDYDSNEEDVDEQATVSGSIAAQLGVGDKSVDALSGAMASASVKDN